MKHYWLHRISHESDVSYPLLDKGYLSLGWAAFSQTNILEAAREKDDKGKAQYNHFESIYSNIYPGDKARQRWSMWYFAQFEKGDTIVVPLADGKFTICSVVEKATPIQAIKDCLLPMKSCTGKVITWNAETNRIRCGDVDTDLGFVVKVEKAIASPVLRKEFADGRLTSRMKMQQTNGAIDDIAYNVEYAISSAEQNQPVNFYATAIEKASAALLETFVTLDPDKFELLVKQYMEKIGADYAYIPAKNEPGKVDEADADVIAMFSILKLNVLIQVKRQQGQTDEHAVIQIANYNKQLKSESSELKIDNDYLNIMWVIASCDFTEEAVRRAAEEDVRLITGKEFSKMLIDAGLSSIAPK